MLPPLGPLFLLLFFATADAYSDTCSSSTCGGTTISYPFWDAYSVSSCGYPGLGLLCEGNATLPIDIRFPQYRVVRIDYDNHSILLRDVATDGGSATCPRFRYNLTSADPRSWLQLAPSTSNVTFLYNCNSGNSSRRSAVRLRECPSKSGRNMSSYLLLDGDGLSGDVYGCEDVVVAPVADESKKAMVRASAAGSGILGVMAEFAGFQMRYSINSERCNLCEQSGGRCLYGRVEEHGEPDFTCFCDDGANEHRCGDARLKRRKQYIIASTSSILSLCLLSIACMFGYKYGSKRISKETTSIKTFKEYVTKRISHYSQRPQKIESLFLQKTGTLHPKRYNYREVKRMTMSFAAKLGQGGFGAVYSGKLSDGRMVAVKMLKDSKGDGNKFINEVVSISKTSHVNIVTLLGFCLQGSKRALIYEYMPNGSLERYAFNKNSKCELSLAWEKLFDIAVGTARGLEYLHRGCNTRIVHFDIKPHNILLDQNFCPKISDFGMAKLCDNRESIISIGGARGTVGYIAPEVFSKQFGAISSKSDVYSYGMMVLEMVGAREKNIDANSESSSHYFPQWIYEHLDEYCISSFEINGETTELVRKMIVVGLWCIQVIPTNRPTMTRVVEMLEASTVDLELPPKVLLSW